MSYGYCRCGAEVRSRTRGIPSIDTCANGHTYDARLTLAYDPRNLPKSFAPFKTPLDDLTFKPTEEVKYNYNQQNHMPDPVKKAIEKMVKEEAEYDQSQKAEDKFVSPCPVPTPYEMEVLDILIEECAEVIQRATKMKRFGVEEIQPGQSLDNRQRLSEEIGDLLGIMDVALSANILCTKTIVNQIPRKIEKLAKFMQTTPETGVDYVEYDFQGNMTWIMNDGSRRKPPEGWTNEVEGGFRASKANERGFA